MNVPELVALPDESVHPLVHPLDVPEARRPFFLSWLISVLAGPATVASLVVVFWFVAEDRYIGPPVGIFVALAGWAAATWFEREAWAYIPRKRQDRARQLPLSWDLTRWLVIAASAGAALTLLGRRLLEPSVPQSVSAYVVGACAGIVVVIVAEFLWRLAMAIAGRGRLRAALLHLPGLAVVAAVTVYLYRELVNLPVDREWHDSDLVIGAAVLVVVQVMHWVHKARNARDPR
ncbi:hypothetical protein ACQP2P_22410 [Dactylosporangium sp. CA-139114]|uniref:hypothetical protein n=1 Tax=Dactylosporangium sp. CA-139114 TaxID=3239931 RepID=UPI003D950BF0